MATFQSEIVKFIDENDLQRSSLAIQCSIKIIENQPNINQNQVVLQQGVVLASSKLINGQPIVNDLMSLFRKASEKQIISENTFQQLIINTSLETRSAARVAAVVISTNQQSLTQYVNKFVQIMNNKNNDEQEIVRATLCLG